MNEIHRSLARQGLVRPHQGRVLGGVCAGLGRRFGIAPRPAHLLSVLVLLLVIPGIQLLTYPILWILMPSEEAAAVPTPQNGPDTTERSRHHRWPGGHGVNRLASR